MSMSHLIGDRLQPYKPQKGIATKDHKTKFVLSYVAGKRVLDLGCVQHNPDNVKSKYWLHKAILNNANYVLGLDLYKEGVHILRSQGYNIVVGDAENFQLDELFDVIVAGDIIEHLSNPGKMLEYARTHVRPGGLLLITTPNPWWWRFIAKSALLGSAQPNPEHTTWFCKDTLSQLLRRYGWHIKEIRYGSRYFLDKIMPVPASIKHGTIHVCAEIPLYGIG